MDWSQAFDFGKKIGYPEICSLMVSALALVVAYFSYSNSVEARREAMPAVSVDTILEGYDTRSFSIDGRVLWYWALGITNTGGRSLSLQRIAPEQQGLPMVMAAKNYQLLEARPELGIYVFDKPKFEEIGRNPAVLSQIEPKNLEELGSINLQIPPGETRALYMAFATKVPAGVADALSFNLKLGFNTGASHSISKFVSIKPRSDAKK
jgi:hypothetical protein